MAGSSDVHNLVGERIGGYRVTGFIASGGMGDVYRGIQESLDRPVAIKILAPRLSAHTDFRERFEREARVAARLDHPNAVHILDFGSVGTTYYMVLELIDGDNLREVLRQHREEGRRLPLERTVDIVKQVGAALTAAHALGFIHRDVKPGNVLLRSDGEPVLTDFGVVKDLASTDLTSPGMMLGVPQYKAPEEFNDVDSVGPASDQYALAVMTYEMLTGRPPFEAPTPAAMMLKHVSEPVTPPSSIVGGLPVQLDAVLNRALAKQPTARYASIDYFTRALVSASTEAPSSPHPDRVPASSLAPTEPVPLPASEGAASSGGLPTRLIIAIFVIAAVIAFVGVIVLSRVLG